MLPSTYQTKYIDSADRQKTLETWVLKLVNTLPAGDHDLNMVLSYINKKYGSLVYMDCMDNSFWRGLATKYPKKLDCTFTLGLNSIHIK